MKKHLFFSIVLAIVLALSLTGCDDILEQVFDIYQDLSEMEGELYLCETCGEITIKTEDIPATYTTDGVSASYYCQTCDKVVKQGEIIPALIQGTDMKAPSFTVNEGILHLSVYYTENAFDFNDKILVNDKSNWILSLDESGNEVVESKTASLSLGENRFYIIVTDTDGNVKKYEVVITASDKIYSVVLAFDCMGGAFSADEVIPTRYDRTADSPLPLPTPTLTYYSFKGWSLEADGSGTLYTELPVNYEITEESVMYLYAVWERQIGFITYDLNGGVNPENVPTSYLAGESVELPVPTKQYFEFLGWSLGDAVITNINESQKGDLSLVAMWKQVETPITFLLGIEGASLPGVGDTFPTEEGIDDLMDSKYIPTASGHLFVGWYEDADLKIPAYDVDENTTDPVTVYAKWVKAPTPGGNGWIN